MDLAVSVLYSYVLHASSACIASYLTIPTGAPPPPPPPQSQPRVNAKTCGNAIATRTQFMDLPDELLARLLAFTSARDVESITVASKTVACHVVPLFPIWKTIFRTQWEKINFPLDGAQCEEDPTAVEIDANLRAHFPRLLDSTGILVRLLADVLWGYVYVCSSCSESRVYQLLAHAITPVPSYVDIEATKQNAQHSWMGHMYVSTRLGTLRSFFLTPSCTV